MSFRALITVGNYDFPEPSTYDSNTSTLVDSGRNAEGKMIGSVIRDNVSKIEISWKFLTVEQWSNILKCFNINSGGKFINNVTFFDQVAGGWITKEMYVSDKKASVFRRNPNTGEVVGWVNPSLRLVEV